MRVLHDPGDTAAVTHALLAAHAPPAGVVVVHPTPGATGGGHAGLGVDILHALGHSIARLGIEDLGGRVIWHALAAWITADRIRYLVVLRAHRLAPAQRCLLIELQASTGVRLVLVWHAILAGRDPLGIAPTDTEHRITTDLAGLLGEIAAHPPPTAADNPADAGDLPAVPDSEFDTFRADAARALDDTGFQRVDAVYTTALHRMCGYLAAREYRACGAHGHNLIDVWEGRAHPVRGARGQWRDVDPTVFGTAHTDEPAGEAAYPLQTMLTALVADSAGPHCTLTRVRAAQAALQLHGWRLDLPNLAYAVGLGLTTTPLTTALITRIRTEVSSPIRAAALVLALFTGATFGELSMIYIDHLDPTNTLLDTGRHRRIYVVPPISRPLLAAAAIHARLTKPDRRGLFVASTGSQGGKLRSAADHCRIVLPSRHSWTDTWISSIRVRPYHPPPTDALRYALLALAPSAPARVRG
ncbi:hypothetical protein ABZ413_17400 [Nocardia rhamnosiphila]|uniref:hypothetical protein n=1 Tax=Nocardia rhamnosiphila TaxID=426716 RepID=UPI0033D11671